MDMSHEWKVKDCFRADDGAHIAEEIVDGVPVAENGRRYPKAIFIGRPKPGQEWTLADIIDIKPPLIF